ncbi:hypothetical protein EJ110_NYTH01358 [Nymphaea thermarum]|nr:hypothetical protein EJ110_NYTH01358 [Nymphaea thermarum]
MPNGEVIIPLTNYDSGIAQIANFLVIVANLIGSAVGGTASAFYGFNHAMPVIRRWVKGPMWLHFFIGAPPVIIFSSACAGLAGGAVPALAQLASSSYHAAFSASSTPNSSSRGDKIKKSTTATTL